MKAVKINGIIALASPPWGHSKAMQKLMKVLGLTELGKEHYLDFGHVNEKDSKIVFVDEFKEW